ncbi:MAG: AAA family ATPase [Coriobacteriia bacterium]|nr:AAA family ATPase [Coriobacteriia bacterium]
MLKRKAYQKLLDWKQKSNGSTALLIEGARRVGKSTLVQEFGANEYDTCLVIDFTFAPDDVIGYFNDLRHDLDSFFLYLSAFYQVPLHERKSLIIFDEVQAFPKARESIKQLVADGRYDYLETGSLISIRKNVKDILIPSEERSMRLDSFDFEEFLWALEEAPLAEAIADAFARLNPLPASLHRKAMRLFREYMLVGGMPQAVQEYARTRSFEAVDEIKRDILKLYRNDIAKYAGTATRRVTAIFDTIAGQLSKHEKRFNIASLGKSVRLREYEDAFFWLSDAFITNDCFNSTDPNVSLKISEDRSTIKCYMADTGLLVTHALATSETTPESIYRDILLEKIGINEGMFTENIVAQQLHTQGHELFFYSRSNREKSSENIEIDFLIVAGYANAAMRARVSPVEVKSSKRYSTASLDKFKARFGTHIGTQYVICPKELTVDGDRVTLPLYMAGCL